MNFSPTPQPVGGDRDRKAYVADAGTPRFPAPSAAVTRNGREVTLNLAGSSAADGMTLSVPAEAALSEVILDGKSFPVSGPQRRLLISCASPGCRNATVTLKQSQSRPFTLLLSELRYGLPPDGEKLQRARGPLGTASQFGDGVELMRRLRVD